MIQWFKSKHKITLLDGNWDVIGKTKMTTIPNQYDLIYSDDLGKYYEVIKVIHDLNRGVFLVLKDFLVKK